jgi:hypothetical protein
MDNSRHTVVVVQVFYTKAQLGAVQMCLPFSLNWYTKGDKAGLRRQLVAAYLQECTCVEFLSS